MPAFVAFFIINHYSKIFLELVIKFEYTRFSCLK